MKNGYKRVNIFKVLLSYFKHRCYVYLRPRYTINSMLKRKGGCKACGICCIKNVWWCRYLKEGKCEIYYKQPFFCRIFPIDTKDKVMSEVDENCGYWWGANS